MAKFIRTAGFRRFSPGFTLIEIMVSIAIVSLLTLIAIPNFANLRNKAFCAGVEADARHIAVVLSEYFSVVTRDKLPEVEDLNLSVSNPVEISGTPDLLVIEVTDQARKCPIHYQQSSPRWDLNHVYTKTIP